MCLLCVVSVYGLFVSVCMCVSAHLSARMKEGVREGGEGEPEIPYNKGEGTLCDGVVNEFLLCCDGAGVLKNRSILSCQKLE